MPFTAYGENVYFGGGVAVRNEVFSLYVVKMPQLSAGGGVVLLVAAK